MKLFWQSNGLKLLSWPLAGLLFTFLLRAYAGDSVTGMLNQAVLALYFLGAIGWAVFCLLAALVIFQRLAGQPAPVLLSWLTAVAISAGLPWLIGPQ